MHPCFGKLERGDRRLVLPDGSVYRLLASVGDVVEVVLAPVRGYCPRGTDGGRWWLVSVLQPVQWSALLADTGDPVSADDLSEVTDRPWVELLPLELVLAQETGKEPGSLLAVPPGSPVPDSARLKWMWHEWWKKERLQR